MDPFYAKTFSVGHIGQLTTKNRLVMPPIVHNYADESGYATPRYVAHIDRMVEGGVGTIILEASFVRQDGKGFRNQLGLHVDSVVHALRPIVDAGHRQGVIMGIQLFHGGRQASEKVSGSQPVAPSSISCPVVNEVPRELTVAEIGDLVTAFGAAARRAKQAGFDFVEIHGAHGYLIAQFLSPFSNHRTDEYGGSPQKRRRFLEEVYAAVREATDPYYPITVRLSGEETIPGALTIDDTVATAQRLEALGVAALHISCGNYATYALGTMIPPMAIEDGVLRPLAQRVKRAVGIPVIAVGKIRMQDMVEDVLAKGDADFVAIGRSLLADPDWPKKVQSGASKEVRHCVACNQGCISQLFAQEPITCTINPECGREREFAHLRGGKGRKLLVVGGGPAGMAAARWGALAGFDVVLHEAQSVLGGQLLAASTAPHRQDWETLRNYMIGELERLHVEVHLNSHMDAAMIKCEKPWATVIATGSRPVRPALAGTHAIPVVAGRAVLEEKVSHQGRTVVVGGGCSGAQTAEYLASCGHKVTIVEAQGDVAIDAPVDERMLLLRRLQRHGVKVMANTRMLNIGEKGVLVLSPEETTTLPADMVVICLGSQPVNALAVAASEASGRVRIVGDAAHPRKITEAIAEGALAILNLSTIAQEKHVRAEV